MKRIAVVTSGGDAPGMNAAIRAVVREAIFHKLEVLGIHRGYTGLIDNQFTHMNLRSVSGIINRGGTILKTVRCPEIRKPEGLKKAVANLKRNGVEGLVVIGGDGSLAAAKKISDCGIPAVCVPGSIDNDIFGTDETIGFDTALDTAVMAVDKIRDTADSHERVFIIEVMGREHGFLALSVGIASGAEFILIPEIKYDVNKVCAELKKERQKGKTSIIMIFAEGAGDPNVLAERIDRCTGLEARVSSLGYIQRGGDPSGRSRILACRFGARAVNLLMQGKKNRLVVMNKGRISDIPFSKAAGGEKKIDKALYKLATELSI
jgi:6-phosphofructokinase 1